MRRSVANPAGAAARAATAHAMLAQRDARPTKARIAVLSVLLAGREALTHHEIENRLSTAGEVDRVTLYRVLEWLTAHGLAHKLSADDRVWRFAAAGHGHAGGDAHAHFECRECGKVICLTETRMPSISLPRGFRRREVEVTVKGSCAACAR
jgi:Fur family ferric uptake transcriptional regulator